ncbi:uncharacterized protein AMSG_11602 [Thecamonas trahens ATCC 50062]|uniref:carnosine N-methyltransferase n=1 Tax=Thecamonas trahens ATCC 50062 TaxID=461836 RepID=A0A0L0DBN3_THETB|nr:hypothetical protein AMSG_11602 [Thecamonas trahens ATCC 50062]KNC48708.1 hypothetical protein AMSG_11602 [Thecamonas trahens ATCC 50062]|eukprot:XP_013762873.1 hypothetical protein AMSG_11602 [Thecamonas trahens ATCC 50062]
MKTVQQDGLNPGTADDGVVLSGEVHEALDPAEEEAREEEHFRDIVRAILFYRLASMRSIELSALRLGQLPPAHRARLQPIMGPALTKWRACVEANYEVLVEIVDVLGLPWLPRPQNASDSLVELMRGKDRAFFGNIRPQDSSKVESTLRQFVRDWAADGAAERDACYGPLLDAVDAAFADADKSRVRIAVPGAGLGRLVWEFAHRGYIAQGNEFSYFMLLASNWMLNHVTEPNSVTLYPNTSTTTNLIKREHQFAPVTIPDVSPLNIPDDAQFSMVAGDFLEVYGAPDAAGAWDVLATCFFIDTARNLCAYLDTISHMLAPGAIWVNIGPLLYHFADMPNYMSVELAWDEVELLITEAGFALERVEHVPSTYAGSALPSLMRVEYNSIFFVARKTNGSADEEERAAL